MPAIAGSDINAVVKRASLKHGVPVTLIQAIIQTESSWNPSAYRTEPKINDASWGLMQVLLRTARETSGNPSLTASELLKPETNIDIGTKYLGKQLKRYGSNINNAIAAYNAGSAMFTSTGAYVNQNYVNKVNKWLTYYKAKTAVAGVGPIAIGAGAVLGLMMMSRRK